jgi:hypothetical protein
MAPVSANGSETSSIAEDNTDNGDEGVVKDRPTVEQENAATSRAGLHDAVRCWLRHGREAGEDFAAQLSRCLRSPIATRHLYRNGFTFTTGN